MRRIARLLPVLLLIIACRPAAAQTLHEMERARARMVDDEIVAAGVKNPRVIAAMRVTPRHEFVPLKQRPLAYLDMALPIGEQQTISPPFVVAYMTEQLDPRPSDRVLEIGTGSGYQAAVLSPLVREVYTIEIVESLGRTAARTLKRLKYRNVFARIGDGYLGWPEKAPFDKIIVTCSPERVPRPLAAQLREGGRMIVPVGERYQQNLYLFTKRGGKLVPEALRPTLFVPMTGTAETARRVQPDPLHPRITNGGFETLIGEPPRAGNWHYQRQMKTLTEPGEAREGERYACFANEEPGRGCRALQGFAVDGRKVSRLDVSLWVRGEGLRYGQNRQQWPRLLISFYDERRAAIGQGGVGPWVGSFPWQREEKSIEVPLKAREAVLRVGLLGGIGKLCVDEIEVKRRE